MELLQSYDIRCTHAMRKILREKRARLEELGERRVMQTPGAYIDQRRLELDRMSERLAAAGRALLSTKKQKYAGLCAALDAMSPLKVLSRGYSMVTDKDGRVLCDTRDTVCGEAVEVTLACGSMSCRVESIREITE